MRWKGVLGENIKTESDSWNALVIVDKPREIDREWKCDWKAKRKRRIVMMMILLRRWSRSEWARLERKCKRNARRKWNFWNDWNERRKREWRERCGSRGRRSRRRRGGARRKARRGRRRRRQKWERRGVRMRENRGAVRRARNHLATPPLRVVVRVLRKSESEGCRAKELRIDGRRITSEDT